MVVFDFVFILFMISAGKGLPSWLSACDVFIYCRIKYICSFPVRCLWQDVEFDRVGSFSLPFHLLKDISFFLVLLSEMSL